MLLVAFIFFQCWRCKIYVHKIGSKGEFLNGFLRLQDKLAPMDKLATCLS
jgi:hypothetical protein